MKLEALNHNFQFLKLAFEECATPMVKFIRKYTDNQYFYKLSVRGKERESEQRSFTHWGQYYSHQFIMYEGYKFQHTCRALI